MTQLHPQSIPLFDLETSRLNPMKELVILIQNLNKKLSQSTLIDTLKSFLLEQVFVIKKTIPDIQECLNNKEMDNDYLMSLIDQINFLKKRIRPKIQ